MNNMEDNNHNKEIENMMNELPIVSDNVNKEKVNKPKAVKKKFSVPKKKVIVYLTIAFIIIIGLFIITNLNKPCDCGEKDCSLEKDLAKQEFVSSMKQQILNQGYVEISENGKILKLSPYIN